jgi:hypothetical protein
MTLGTIALSELEDQLLLAVVAFALTTVPGGAVASWYQSRRVLAYRDFSSVPARKTC